MRNWLLILALLSGIVVTASAQPRIDVIDLKQRTSEEMIRLISPMLEDQESASGVGFQLILQAEPGRLEELRTLVDKLDRQLHQLRISVRQGQSLQSSGQDANAQGQITLQDEKATLSAQGYVLSTRKQTQNTDRFQVTTLEGTPVYIAHSLSFPVTGITTQIVNGTAVNTPHTDYHSASSGFYAKAWLQPDNRVTVDIAPQRETLASDQYGAIQHQSLSTRVQGKLGQWLLIGGNGVQETERRSGTGLYLRTQDRNRQQVWLRVERVD